MTFCHDSRRQRRVPTLAAASPARTNARGRPTIRHRPGDRNPASHSHQPTPEAPRRYWLRHRPLHSSSRPRGTGRVRLPAAGGATRASRAAACASRVAGGATGHDPSPSRRRQTHSSPRIPQRRQKSVTRSASHLNPLSLPNTPGRRRRSTSSPRRQGPRGAPFTESGGSTDHRSHAAEIVDPASGAPPLIILNI